MKLLQNPELLQIFIFAVIGVWNTLLDFIIFWGLLKLLEISKYKKTKRLIPVVNVISFTISNVQSFFLNSWFTFAQSSQNNGFLTYFGVTLISLTISTLLIFFLNRDYFFKKLPTKNISHRQFVLIIKLFTILVGMFINFFGYKYLVF
jgi:putative flippase GtrA